MVYLRNTNNTIMFLLFIFKSYFGLDVLLLSDILKYQSNNFKGFWMIFCKYYLTLDILEQLDFIGAIYATIY